MKRIVFTTALALFASNMFAQLTVNENGNVRILSSNSNICNSPLTIGGNGVGSYLISLDSSDKGGIYVKAGTGDRGIEIQHTGSGAYAYPRNTNGTNLKGFWGLTGACSGKSYGVCGAYFNYNAPSIPDYAAGIYGSSTMNDNFNFIGIYAGYFNGDVRVTGTTYINNLGTQSLSSSPNATGVIGVEPLAEGENLVLSQLSELPVLKVYNEVAENTEQHVEIPGLVKEDGTFDEEILQAYLDENSDCSPIQTAAPAVRYELAAEQLRNVYPELVFEDKDGNIAINYVEMVPLLVQAINELQAKVEVLEKKEAGEKPASKAKANAVATLSADEIQMAQNDPNPFNSTSTIELNIPASVNTAYLIIYDMNGKQLDKRLITDRGATTVTLNAADLYEGMFLYSLTCDGKVVSTKRMIISK